jgi:hypothetical protein
MKNTKGKIEKRRCRKESASSVLIDRLAHLKLDNEDVRIISSLIKNIFNYRGIEKSDLGSRYRHMIDTNIALCTSIRKSLAIPYQTIADIVGKKAHATIMYYERIHESLMITDKKYAEVYGVAQKTIDCCGLGNNFILEDVEPIDNQSEINIVKRQNRILKCQLELANSKIKDLKDNVSHLNSIITL